MASPNGTACAELKSTAERMARKQAGRTDTLTNHRRVTLQANRHWRRIRSKQGDPLNFDWKVLKLEFLLIHDYFRQLTSTLRLINVTSRLMI